MQKCIDGNCWITSLLFVALLGSMVGFSGCSTGTPAPATSTPVITSASAQRAVALANAAYGVAVRAADVYAKFPRCGTPVVQPCSSQSALNTMVTASIKARQALKDADKVASDPQFGVDAFTTAAAVMNAAMVEFTASTAAVAPSTVTSTSAVK